MSHTNALTSSAPRVSLSRGAFCLLIGSLFAVATFSGEAQARERHIAMTGANGKTAARDILRKKGDVSSTTTGPNGKTSSRVVDRSEAGTSATVSGFNGNTATRETTRTDSGSTTTVTGPDGKSGTVVVTH
jgi:hypothetical protein